MDSVIRRFLSRIGAKGGKASGAAKVRGDSEHYRKIALLRKKKTKA